MSDAGDALSKLQNVRVEPSLKNFQNGAVGGIEMLSVGFYGIIEAFKDEMEKSREIASKMDSAFADISSLKSEMSAVNARCEELNRSLDTEIKSIRKALQDQWAEIDKKFIAQKDSLEQRCDGVKTECMAAVATISNKVGKSLENVDRLKEQFESLETETKDQLRGLSARCEENKDLIEEQDSKFKQSLADLTEILHEKAMDLDRKIEECLEQTTERINQFDAKQQEFQFETNKELANKADIEDMKHKLDISAFEEFKASYTAFAEKEEAQIKQIETRMADGEGKQQQLNEHLCAMTSKHEAFKEYVEGKFSDMQSAIDNPVDTEGIKQEVQEAIREEQELMKEELIALIKQSAAGISNPPAFGSKSGNCIACGRNSSFKPMQVTSPSPKKKPKHGGGFNRIDRRKSANVGHKFKSGEDIMRESGGLGSPKSPSMSSRRRSTGYVADLADPSNALLQKAGMKVLIDNGPLKLPEVDNI